jgi:hypothetical protein
VMKNCGLWMWMFIVEELWFRKYEYLYDEELWIMNVNVLCDDLHLSDIWIWKRFWASMWDIISKTKQAVSISWLTVECWPSCGSWVMTEQRDNPGSCVSYLDWRLSISHPVGVGVVAELIRSRTHPKYYWLYHYRTLRDHKRVSVIVFGWTGYSGLPVSPYV